MSWVGNPWASSLEPLPSGPFWQTWSLVAGQCLLEFAADSVDSVVENPVVVSYPPPSLSIVKLWFLQPSEERGSDTTCNILKLGNSTWLLLT